MSRACLVATLLAACQPTAPEGVFSCSADEDCPEEQLCFVADGFCYRDARDAGPDDGGGQDAGRRDAGTSDASIDDAGADAGGPRFVVSVTDTAAHVDGAPTVRGLATDVTGRACLALFSASAITSVEGAALGPGTFQVVGLDADLMGQWSDGETPTGGTFEITDVDARDDRCLVGGTEQASTALCTDGDGIREAFALEYVLGTGVLTDCRLGPNGTGSAVAAAPTGLVRAGRITSVGFLSRDDGSWTRPLGAGHVVDVTVTDTLVFAVGVAEGLIGFAQPSFTLPERRMYLARADVDATPSSLVFTPFGEDIADDASAVAARPGGDVFVAGFAEGASPGTGAGPGPFIAAFDATTGALLRATRQISDAAPIMPEPLGNGWTVAELSAGGVLYVAAVVPTGRRFTVGGDAYEGVVVAAFEASDLSLRWVWTSAVDDVSADAFLALSEPDDCVYVAGPFADGDLVKKLCASEL